MSVLRNIFKDYGTSENSDNNISARLFSYNIDEINGGGACPLCNGRGTADTINEDTLIKNVEKSILCGGLEFVSDKGIKFTKISEKFIEAFCKEYKIDINCPVGKLDKAEISLIMRGSNKIIKFTDKSGANNGKKELKFPGIVGALMDVYNRTKNEKISAVVVNGICPACLGSRYNRQALSYMINGKNISEVLNMSITDSRYFIDSLLSDKYANVDGLKKEFHSICEELESIGVGYLNLSRSVSSVSGGELQIIKLARQLALDMIGYCYVLDEPSTGLHFSDIDRLMKSLIRLKNNGNTILLVEHNIQLLRSCDYIVEMGEKGGIAGGRVVNVGTLSEVVKQNSLTSVLLRSENIDVVSHDTEQFDEYISITNVSVNNLKNISLKVPLNCFVTVAGVSGSGKSTAINNVLAQELNAFLLRKPSQHNLVVKGTFERFISLEQDQTVANSRSYIASMLDVMDEIKNAYANTIESKGNGFDKTFFGFNSGKGICEYCNGSGSIIDDDGESEEVCPICDGKRYRDDILEILYKGYNIAELLALNIEELIPLFEGNKIEKILRTCQDIGIGYLSLDRSLPSLSKGELQRLRIVKEICNDDVKKTIFLLDEPSKGLHDADTSCIVSALKKLVSKGHTVIAIEHNLQVIAQSDYLIEFGPGAGDKGGLIVFEGSPSDILKSETETSKAFIGIQSLHKNNSVLSNGSNKVDIKFSISDLNESYSDIAIKRNQINVIHGGIASGKSTIASKILFAIPFKIYVSGISNQGKYLTRDIQVKNCDAEQLPLSRLINITDKFYKRYERVSETLDLDYYISTLFYDYGNGKCNAKGVIHKNAFNMSKKSCKCDVCSGKGRITTYDFETIFEDKCLTDELYALLYDRTRYKRISPLIKDKYKLDLSKPYNKLNDDEKKLFLYGNKKMEVIYSEKNKTYHWDGCNDLLRANIAYAKENLANILRESFGEKVCPYCNGKGVESQILEVKYKDISFEKFIYSDFDWLLKKLSEKSALCIEEEKLIEALTVMVNLKLGNLSLASYMSELSLGEKSIIKYLNYKFNPLYDTMIVWDDFSAGKNSEVIELLLQEFKEMCQLGVTFALFEEAVELKGTNEIVISDKFRKSEIIDNSVSTENFGCFLDKDLSLAEDRIDMHLSSKTSIATLSGTIAKIRNEFRKKYPQYTFVLQNDDEKCIRCKGLGYYEINTGKLGMNECKCPDCNGTGINESLEKCTLHGRNIAELLSMSVSELYLWLGNNGYSSISKSLKVFIDLGIGSIQYGKGINQISFNEGTMIIIAKFLLSKETTLQIKNAFIDVSSNEITECIARINISCVKFKKKIKLVL